MKKCAVYTRVSTAMQAEKNYSSCDAQRDRIENYIKSQDDLELLKEYRDPGFTASNVNRPALQEMMRDINSGLVDCVLTYKIDRLTRSSKDFYNIIEVFDTKGVTYVSVTEHFNTASAAGRLLRNIMLTFAQFEREMTSERVRDKCQQNAMKGLWVGGITPLGYKRNKNGVLLPHPYSAKWIPLIFEKYSETQCATETYEFVKNQNLKHDQLGRIPSINSIRRLLKNPVYTGIIRWKDQKFPGQHKRLISDDLFNHVQTFKQKKRRKKRCYKNFFLKSLIECGEC
jgi:site-specific DNA recombinase